MCNPCWLPWGIFPMDAIAAGSGATSPPTLMATTQERGNRTHSGLGPLRHSEPNMKMMVAEFQATKVPVHSYLGQLRALKGSQCRVAGGKGTPSHKSRHDHRL